MKNIYILPLILFIISCGDKVREEITERYDNGQKKSHIIYKGEGSKEVISERITYNENGDTLIWEKPLDKFKMVREYYDNGQISIKGNFKDGKRDGRWLFYYSSNGQIWTENNFNNGKQDGKYTSYYNNGQIKIEGNYINGLEDGKWTNYNEDGKITYERNYKDGKLVE